MRNDCPATMAAAPALAEVRRRSTSSMTPRSSTILSRTLLGRRVALDELADLGEVRLGLDRQGRVDDPQRDLDVLEVVEVAAAGLGQGLGVVAGAEQVERLVDRDPDALQLRDGVLPGHAGGGGAAGGEQPEPDGHGHQDQERPQPCHGCLAR